MMPVEAKSLAIGNTGELADPAGPFLHGLQVIVHPVMFEQPQALALVTGKHLTLGVQDRGDVDDEIWPRRPAISVRTLGRVSHVQMRDLGERGPCSKVAGRVIGTWRREAGVADEAVRCLVVAMIVNRRGGNDKFGLHLAQDRGHAAAGSIVFKNGHIAEARADVVCADQRGGIRGLLAPDRGNLCRGVSLGAAVACCHRYDRDLMPARGQQGKRPARKNFGVVGMGVDMENSHAVPSVDLVSMRPALPIAAVLLIVSCGKTDTASEQAKREAEFAKMLTGATLAGSFTSGNSNKLSQDRYEISKASKLAGDIWTIQTRIQYGERDVTVPVPVRVVWAGDTPMITLTDVAIPGLGTYTARVVFYRGQYAGMWSGGNHGGQMFGRIERTPVPPQSSQKQ
jgi:hypothetical protein